MKKKIDVLWARAYDTDGHENARGGAGVLSADRQDWSAKEECRVVAGASK
jgi:hypothetical protein